MVRAAANWLICWLTVVVIVSSPPQRVLLLAGPSKLVVGWVPSWVVVLLVVAAITLVTAGVVVVVRVGGLCGILLALSWQNRFIVFTDEITITQRVWLTVSGCRRLSTCRTVDLFGRW